MSCAVTLRSYAAGGTGSAWIVTNATGVDDIVVKSADTDLHFANGVVASRDYLAATPLIFDVQTKAGLTAAQAQAALVLLRAAWLPSGTNLTLTVAVGALSTTFGGRPRGMSVDRKLAAIGIIRAQLTFLDTK